MRRILALDVGDKYIGVAVSDELGITAQGVDVINRQGIIRDISRIRELIDSNSASSIVIGLPRKMDNSLGIQAEKVMDFVESVKKEIKTPVILWDERLTTAQAQKVLINAGVRRKKRKSVIDKLAAQLILQNYLDFHSKKETA